ncbi:DsbA family protein [Methylovirgula sp. HY1]|uniref:DsbA family protein n=1 Tax=Methylovirgula sp. HY1 TaxID=2822761 RepID=UPI001C5BD7D8|nr:DsbA family protein [Methylovirgula sp. HY1]QXX73970.1 Disulfide bond formation protein D [Methylovirgula sp. HY1]
MAFLSALLKSLITAAALCCLAGAAFAASQFSPAQKGEIEQIIKSYIMTNPEILRDAITELDRREKTAEATARSKIISNLKGPLYVSPTQAIVGNPNGKITLVEFFDYNCGYCKKSLPDIARLIKENPDLRVILKDYPILSKGSVEASEIATAFHEQFSGEKFWQFHKTLLGSHGYVGRAQAIAVAKDLGANMDQLTKDAAAPSVKKGLEQNDQLGQALMLTGTPSFVIGDETIIGAVGYDELKTKLDNVRKCGKVICS